MKKLGRGNLFPPYKESEGKMYTISNILQDVNRGILAHNMIENYFSYRIVYFINSGEKGEKRCIDVSYDGLRMALENIIRRNLTTTNTVVVAAVTVRKDGESVPLLSRAYAFSLDGYFKQISGEYTDRNRSGNCNRYAMV